MKILSIETSCDDTGITIFEAKGGVTSASFKVLADKLASQTVHEAYGGVFPMLAKREHIKNLPILLAETLKLAKLNKLVNDNFELTGKKKPVDLITVTYGPGLEPSLWTGITFAKELSKKWGVPVEPVNHMEGHLLSFFGKNKGQFKIKKPKTPVLAMLVSGGHTELILMKDWMEYKIIGETLDDAVGEAFDKVARMLGLPYPGGPHISRLAEELRNKIPLLRGGSLARRGGKILPPPPSGTPQEENKFVLPRPMIYSKDFNFSYSGLKTSVLYLIRDLEKSGPAKDGVNKKINDKIKSEIALEFENAAIECLTHKTKKAIEKFGIKTLVLGGGVAANKHLQRELKKLVKKDLAEKKIELMLPTFELSRDNSVMIGIAGYLNYLKRVKKGKKINPESIKAVGNLRLE